MQTLILETARLSMRQFTMADVDNLYGICGDANLMRYTGNGLPLTRAEVERWIEVTLANYAANRTGIYAVETATTAFAGYCGLVGSKEVQGVELIYALKKSMQGYGLATEMAAAMVGYGFAVHRLEKIFASIDPENLASKRILEKTGFIELCRREDEWGLPTLFYVLHRPDTV